MLNADVVQRRELSCQRRRCRLWVVSPLEICARPSQHCRAQSGSRFNPHLTLMPHLPPPPRSFTPSCTPSFLPSQPSPPPWPSNFSPFMHHNAAECTQAQGRISPSTPPHKTFHCNTAECHEIAIQPAVLYLHLEPEFSRRHACALPMLQLPGQLQGSCALLRDLLCISGRTALTPSVNMHCSSRSSRSPHGVTIACEGSGTLLHIMHVDICS